MKSTPKEEKWDLEIEPLSGLFDINWRELWQYRDLLGLFVRRDIVSTYKQTVLGPLWFFIQPILTTLIYVLIFGNIAGISTGGVPKVLFYLSGITLWNYFQECLLKTASTFSLNQNLFGKVYFPRLIAPLSIIISNLFKFFVQLTLFLVTWVYFLVKPTSDINPNSTLLLFPIYLLLLSGLGLSFGLLISSMTTKYRDLRYLIQFGVQLLMYATPIVYPLSIAPEKYRWLIQLNPITSIVEAFKYSFLGEGYFSVSGLVYSFVCMLVTLAVSILVFNRVEKSFMDTV
ncbi:ABC transporter permease [Rhabdobacter roseus]|uniref:Transport permease protein n=1 Tax=Rhabdobacter roseus TaxID=1655419 RepID=A0A840TLA0_9BACT|nr:ABC transporter permease [Rhabdobacter roseus]MBB5284976.1 lipopolysaccharide transport system permease protein [Rhabdobacter roseus]